MIIIRVLAVLAATGAYGVSVPLHAQSNKRPVIEFVVPLDCQVGSNCFVQNYVDVDPTRRYRDHTCLGLSYDGHKGTDFRLPSRSEMESGIAVFAAAKGIVKGFRDGETDGLFFDQGMDAMESKECGNGVVIDHGNGWETQYCHLKNGSLQVYRGKDVRAGDTIGLVGMSGKSQFVHLHFEARYNDKTIDPFTGAAALDGCGVEAYPLWTQEALNYLDYQSSGLLNQGFSTEPPDLKGIENGIYNDESFSEQSPALIYHARIFGLRNGDIQELVIDAPDGTELVRAEKTHDGGSKAQFMQFVGKKRPDGGWPTGIYEGRYQLIRGGRILLRDSLVIEIGDLPEN